MSKRFTRLASFVLLRVGRRRRRQTAVRMFVIRTFSKAGRAGVIFECICQEDTEYVRDRGTIHTDKNRSNCWFSHAVFFRYVNKAMKCVAFIMVVQRTACHTLSKAVL